MIDAFREAGRHLITSVALITTTGARGPNVMSAEWTFQVSYRPMRLAVLVHPRDATHDNLLESREFGANFLSEEQTPLANLAGHYTGKEVNKLTSEIFRTHSATKIRAPMISECFANMECKVVDVLETGDHTMFLGEVVEVQFDPKMKPLLYSQGRYCRRGPLIEKKPFIYVTCTIDSGQVRLDGRLLGPENHPQEVSLTLSRNNSSQLFKEKAQTDENGYFHFADSVPALEKGVYVAKAEWNGLSGTASTQLLH
jgi:flavin reductase (DIM6/NTAB) family NADH-FMN oxidoreductase RutF